MATIATAVLCFLLSGCTHAAASGAPAATHKSMTLTLPRAATADEAVHVRLAAGTLPRGARIVVRLPNGEIAGSATPYGFRGAKAGIFIIPLPPGAIRNGKVTLELAVEEKGGAVRAPKKGEVERVDLIYVPVTR